jgi:cobalt-zinc-cadmium resistance protein CzcA
MPALASLMLPKKIKARENFVVRFSKWCYRPIVRLAIRLRLLAVTAAVVLLGGGAWLATHLGAEFIPRLSEMGIVINTVRLAGVSLEESVRYGGQMEAAILERFPDEVKNVWTRTGTAEVATDPMGIELSDVFITLKDREQWRRADTQETLTALMREELSGLPGMRLVFTQPIEMRVNEMIAGIRSDLGIKIFGDDFETLKALATKTSDILETIPGSADIYVEQITGQPVIEIEIDQDAIARRGIAAQDVLEIVEAIGTKKIGEIRQDQRRFDLVVRLAEQYRDNPAAIAGILIPAADGKRIPLAQIAHIRQVEGPSTITREWQRRRIVVQCNIADRDVSGFVHEVQERLQRDLPLAPGYHVEYGGQFEHLERARQRLLIVVPLALLLILVLLYMSTNSIGDTLIIFTGAPFAALGGIGALYLRDMPFTISAGVGFVAVSGVAVLNGLVMVSTIRQLRAKGTALRDAIEQGALIRLRPVLMTALVAGLGFVPMAFNTGIGAEVQRPLATVVVGGVLSDTVLTLLILPALYAIFGNRADEG